MPGRRARSRPRSRSLRAVRARSRTRLPRTMPSAASSRSAASSATTSGWRRRSSGLRWPRFATTTATRCRRPRPLDGGSRNVARVSRKPVVGRGTGDPAAGDQVSFPGGRQTKLRLRTLPGRKLPQGALPEGGRHPPGRPLAHPRFCARLAGDAPRHPARLERAPSSTRPGSRRGSRGMAVYRPHVSRLERPARRRRASSREALSVRRRCVLGHAGRTRPGRPGLPGRPGRPSRAESPRSTPVVPQTTHKQPRPCTRSGSTTSAEIRSETARSDTFTVHRGSESPNGKSG